MNNKRIMFIGPLLKNLTNFRGELILELIKEKFEVILVSSYESTNSQFESLGAKMVNIPIDRRGTSITKDIKLTKNYFCIIKEYKPSIVLTYTTKCSIYGGIACTLNGTPYIVNNSGLYNKEDFSKVMWLLLKLLYKIGYSHTQCMMYQNPYERDTLNTILGNKVRYIDIPGSGINLEKYLISDYPSCDKGIILNYVARIVRIKGINEYLACARIIKAKYPNTHFRIFGQYDDNSYKDLIEEASKEGYIEYMGAQSDMLPFIKDCHAVIHPSYYEGMTNVVLEHSAVGRVCIASDIPGCKEGIEEGKTGYLFRKKDIDDLVNVVEKFVLLPYDKKKEMGKAARKKMEREFDRKIVTETYIKEIKRIIS